ncbi:hypothetical protein EJB05_08429, partial [Eragrostis curvula]
MDRSFPRRRHQRPHPHRRSTLPSPSARPWLRAGLADDERAEDLRAAIAMAPNLCVAATMASVLRVRRSLRLPSPSFAGKDVVRYMQAAHEDGRLEWSDARREQATWIAVF